MRPALAVLCYHRIVQDDDDQAWPYLERGTAVRASTLAAQLAHLARVAELIGEDGALEVLRGHGRLTRPAVWLTFDDGYRDVEHVLPLVEAATVFVTTCTATRLLPADAWYALLLSARRTRGCLDLGLGPFEFDLAHRSGRARLVDGPERRAFLRAGPVSQSATLLALAQQLEAEETAPRPYLDAAALRSLVRRGWSVGSHGATHAPFDTLDAGAARHEAATSRDALRCLGPVRSLALPDGAPGHEEVLRALGYECALGLGQALAAKGQFMQPRFLVPDEPAWVARVLEPALKEAADG